MRSPGFNPTGGARRRRGLTLLEIMIAMTILTIGMVGFISAFGAISRSIRVAKARTLASNLAQEQIESLKNLGYYKLLVTTAPAVAAESGVGGYEYDTGYYPPDTVTVGQIQFIRRVMVQKVGEVSGVISPASWADADTGLKQITSYVVWKEGTAWRKVEVTNLRDNPNRPKKQSTISGTISSGTSPVSGVSVYTLQNQTYSAVTSTSGVYSISVPAGTYDLFAKKRGYFPVSVSTTVADSVSATLNMAVTSMGVGSVGGVAYIADHIVISEVCVKVDGDDHVEYVELYNPTGSAISMYGAAAAYDLDFKDTSGNVTQFGTAANLIYVRSQIPSNGYFLIASTMNVKGVNADAYYNVQGQDRLPSSTPGGIRLVSRGLNETVGTVVDAVGWARGSSPWGPSGYREGNGLQLTSGSGGLEDSQVIERIAYSTSTHTMMDTLPTPGIHRLNGNGYDSNDNGADFVYHSHTDNEVPQGATSATEVAVTGTPAASASIFADDGVSTSASAQTTSPVGTFNLTNVATGTCSVVVSSKGYSVETQNVSVALNTQTNLGNILLRQVATKGFLYGTVRVGGAPLSGITVQTSVATTDVTDSNGDYQFQLDPGTYVITANPNNINSSYTTEQTTGTTVVGGAVTTVPDLVLSQGGTVRGYVSSNGIDPLPNVPIVATNTATGVETGSAISDVYGRYTFPNLPVGTYSLTPQLESGESASPSAITSTVTAGASLFVGTMTVSNAFGAIRGTVKVGSSLITTGVLIIAVASPNTISTSLPPLNDQTLRNGSVVYYTASAESDGTYSVAVRGGYTYNVYAWYTSFSGITPTVTKKSSTATLSSGGSATVNFTW